jgi:hypothetical protein
METRHNDNDGSDIFWPGYVDAVTNLVLNLLFLLTIMTVAVFMFALELGRASQGGPEKSPAVSTKQKAETVSKAPADPVKENIALKREIERLNMILAQRVAENVKPVPSGGSVKTVDVTSNVPQPLTGLDKTLASNFEIKVRFKDDAVALTQAEHDQLLETLKPILANGKTSITVEVPAGFSESKRMGFYRAMAVRNLLIELKMPKENINLSVLELNDNANASIVWVR